MDYKATIDYLYQSFPMYQRIGGTAYKADLKNSYSLDKLLNYPHKQFKTIHVGGTNGKGSVSHMLASVLQEEDYKTGLYTSPHLLDFRERIKVNGVPVSKQFVIEFTQSNRQIFEKIKPSFFEMTVFMAFEYFASEKVDVAVIEVGLGGRLDSTNIITPEVSVITNIGKDHTQYLGNTLKEIAEEKAGIIKKIVPVIIGETQNEIGEVFAARAKNFNSDIYFADQHFSIAYSMKNPDNSVRLNFSKCYHWNFQSLETDLLGNYQKSNLITSLMTLAILDKKSLRVSSNSIKEGFKKVRKSTGFLGRWQEIEYNPLVVCDVAHNTEGFQQILMQIENTAYRKLHMVLGFVSDKNIEEILLLLPEKANYYLCEPDIPRAMKMADLSAKFQKSNFSFKSFKKVADAFMLAKANATPDDLIYIGGSTFVVADFLTTTKYLDRPF